MKETLPRNISFALAGMLFTAASLLSSCQTSDAGMDDAFAPSDRMHAAAETRSDGMLMPGSIPQQIIIDTANPGDTFTIASEQQASCVNGGTIRYVWYYQNEIGWMQIDAPDHASLTIEAPMAFATVYRREAVCGSRYVYSNECTVYNKSFLDAGAIPDTIHLNKTTFDYDFNIHSIAPSTNLDYNWEIDHGTGWVNYTDFLANSSQSLPSQRLTRLRCILVTPAGTACSNICTVINHAFRDDPRAGSDFGHAIQLGPFGSDFTESLVVDTRGEYFWDQDRATGGGNDAFINLTLTEPMTVEIITGAAIMMVRTDCWMYFDISSMPYGTSGNPIPTFDTYDPGRSELIRRDLLPGSYNILIQGSKATNAGMVNGILSVSLRGTVNPAITRP